MSLERIGCYCTAGRGTETFVSRELKKLGSVDEIKVTDGKVYFSIPSRNIASLKSLRSVERVFIKVTEILTKEMCNGYRFVTQKFEDHLLKGNLWAQCVASYTLGQEDRLDCESTPAKQRKLNHTDGSHNKTVSFRISCKCSGRISRQCHPQDLSRRIGRKLSRLMGWQIDLRHPDVEVSIHINDEKIVVGIPISSEPLSRRRYIKHHGLRSTVAWIMCSLANIQPGNLILDPLCGKGTLLIEGAENWKEAFFVGVDKFEHQLKMAAENVRVSKTTSVDLIQTDILNSLPLRCNSVDAVICDLPFGQKHEVEEELGKFYSSTLTQIDRVLKPCGHVVLMTSCHLEKSLLQNIEQPRPEEHSSMAAGDACTCAGKEDICATVQDPTATSGTCATVQDPTATSGTCATVEDPSETSGTCATVEEPTATSDSCTLTGDTYGVRETPPRARDTSAVVGDTYEMKVGEICLSKERDTCCKGNSCAKAGGRVQTHICAKEGDTSAKEGDTSAKEEDTSAKEGDTCCKVDSRAKEDCACEQVICSNQGNTCAEKGNTNRCTSPQDSFPSSGDAYALAVPLNKFPQLPWTVGESYYIKLGETHAKICTFQKQSV